MIRSDLEWSLWRLSWTRLGADQTGGEGELEAHEARQRQKAALTRRRVWLGLPLDMEAVYVLYSY